MAKCSGCSCTGDCDEPGAKKKTFGGCEDAQVEFVVTERPVMPYGKTGQKRATDGFTVGAKVRCASTGECGVVERVTAMLVWVRLDTGVCVGWPPRVLSICAAENEGGGDGD